MPDAHERSAAPREAAVRTRLGEGAGAATPARIPARGWGQALRGCARRVLDDRLLGEAAAVAFFALLAVFPANLEMSQQYGQAWRRRPGDRRRCAAFAGTVARLPLQAVMIRDAYRATR